MERIEELKKWREEMKEEGLDTSSIEIKIEKELAKAEEYCSVADALEILKKEFPDEKFSLEKVRVLVRENKLSAEMKAKRLGLRILVKSIYDYVEEEKMTKEDWKARALAAEAELNELKALLERSKVETVENTSETKKSAKNELLEAQTASKKQEVVEKIDFENLTAVQAKEIFLNVWGKEHDLKRKFDRVKVTQKAAYLKELLLNEEYEVSKLEKALVSI